MYIQILTQQKPTCFRVNKTDQFRVCTNNLYTLHTQIYITLTYSNIQACKFIEMAMKNSL